MGDQIFRVAISPAQRLILFNLTFGEGHKLKGQQGRAYRRFLRAFGLEDIARWARKERRVSEVLANDDDGRRWHELTAENVEWAMRGFEEERTPLQELQVGPLFDTLEAIQRRPAEYSAPELAGVGDFDQATEDWEPDQVDDQDDPDELVHAIARYVRGQGQAELAARIEAGAWEKERPNGAREEVGEAQA